MQVLLLRCLEREGRLWWHDLNRSSDRLSQAALLARSTAKRQRFSDARLGRISP